MIVTTAMLALLLSPSSEPPIRVAWSTIQKQSDVPPIYPREARAQGRVELVFLDVVVEKDGTVGEVVSLRGASDFAAAATASLRQWRFRPVSPNGIPTRVTVTLPIGFALEGRSLLGPAKDALRDPQEQVRATAAEYLGRQRSAAKGTLRELYALKGDASSLVRDAANGAIAEIERGVKR